MKPTSDAHHNSHRLSHLYEYIAEIHVNHWDGLVDGTGSYRPRSIDHQIAVAITFHSLEIPYSL